MSAAHDPCVLAADCGPHCGLDRGYLGHCQLCHDGFELGLFGAHDHQPPWTAVTRGMLGQRLHEMPALSPPPG